jgi:hypothetical protein
VKSKLHKKQNKEQATTKARQGTSNNKSKGRSKCKKKQQETKHNAKKQKHVNKEKKLFDFYIPLHSESPLVEAHCKP